MVSPPAEDSENSLVAFQVRFRFVSGWAVDLDLDLDIGLDLALARTARSRFKLISSIPRSAVVYCTPLAAKGLLARSGRTQVGLEPGVGFGQDFASSSVSGDASQRAWPWSRMHEPVGTGPIAVTVPRAFTESQLDGVPSVHPDRIGKDELAPPVQRNGEALASPGDFGLAPCAVQPTSRYH